MKLTGASDVMNQSATSKTPARLSIAKLTDELAQFQRNGGDDYRIKVRQYGWGGINAPPPITCGATFTTSFVRGKMRSWHI